MAPRFLTETELRGEYGDQVIDRLGDRDGDGVVDDGVVEGAILDAEDYALSHLLNRFSPSEIPTTTADTSRMLKVAVADKTYSLLNKQYDNPPQRALTAAQDAEKTFKSIQSGQLSAVLVDTPAVDVARAVIVRRGRADTLSDQPMTLAAMEMWGRERNR